MEIYWTLKAQDDLECIYRFGPVLMIVFGLATFIPSLAVTVRRLHDIDKTGWWLLISLVPFGGLVIFIFTLQEGTPSPNTYGPSPK